MFRKSKDSNWLHNNCFYTFLLAALFAGSLSAEPLYTPPGYAPGQSIEGAGFGLDIGYEQLEEDYYLLLTPQLELPLFKSLKVGLKIPLEILAWDRDPKSDKKVPSLRDGTYNSREDYYKIVRYVRYGTHLYFDPDDLFNWSFYYGPMTDGYLGHKTIVNRYVGNYDPTVYRAGLMFDINNNWGGVEVFHSDVWRREVVGWRGYIRPVGMFYGLHDLIIAGGEIMSPRQVKLALNERRNPNRNGGVFFQESNAPLHQFSHNRLGDEKFDKQGEVRFEEYRDPNTGEVQIRAVPVPSEVIERRERKRSIQEEERTEGFVPDDTTLARQVEREKREEERRRAREETALDERARASEDGYTSEVDDTDYIPPQKWGRTFWSRFAIGYSVVTDYDAPVSLEKDGSGQMVIDPDTNRPRADKGETLTFIGMDAELRLSPFRWLTLTPYVDVNRIKHIEGSKAYHVGVDFSMRIFGNFIKLTFRPEYREYTTNYIPTYFDSYYSLERTIYNSPGTGNQKDGMSDGSMTKLQYLKQQVSINKTEYGGHKVGIVKGGFGELLLDVAKAFIMELNYEDYAGPNNSKVFVGFYIPNLSGFFLNGYYQKKDFETLDESFIFDDRSLMAGELGYSFFGGFYVKATYKRSWEFDNDTNKYVKHDEKSVNFGFNVGI